MDAINFNVISEKQMETAVYGKAHVLALAVNNIGIVHIVEIIVVGKIRAFLLKSWN